MKKGPRKEWRDENNGKYRLTRMDALVIQLVMLHDYAFVEDVLDYHEVCEYGKLPWDVEELVADILEERLMDISPEDVEA